jgi:hypothetical protein
MSFFVLCYADKEPNCIYGAAVFASFGVLFCSAPPYKETTSAFKRKRNK